MAKVSVARTSFNAGEFSPLVEGRVDLDRYPASLRKSINFVAAQQGPGIRRSGTKFASHAYSNDPAEQSRIIPFVFSEEQSLDIEFTAGRVRFILDEGIQTYTPIAGTKASGNVLNIAAHGCAVGDQVVLSGFPVVYNMNGRQAKVTAFATGTITLDIDLSAVPNGTAATIARVYHVDIGYTTWDQIRKMKAVQNGDVLFLFCEGVEPRKLSRYAAYDWRFEVNRLVNGPFQPQERGSGRIRVPGTGYPSLASIFGTGSNPEFAFDGAGLAAGVWEAAADQTGELGFLLATAHVLTGYVIYAQQSTTETNYTALERAPGTWIFQGRDAGGSWITLDTQTDFQAYEYGRTPLITVDNDQGYYGYRWLITSCKRNGPIKPRIAQIGLRFAPGTPCVQLNSFLENQTTVNKGAGWLAGDIGRLIRIKDVNDGAWRVGRITGVNPMTGEFDFELQSETFIGPGYTYLNYQLGYYSDNTGWPNVGEFFEDRLWLGGSTQYPDLISASRTGAYNNFEQRTQYDEVLDDSAMAFRMNTKRLSSIRWMDSDERGLLVGDGSREHVISAASTDGAVTARNIKRRSSTQRGSARYVDQIKVDRQVLFVQNGGRNVREFAYQYEADGYKAPSMTLFASHLASEQYEETAYSAEPFSIVWFRTATKKLVGLTYNRDENVIGWHAHDFSGEVESIASRPSAATKQDQLTLIVMRTLPDGSKRRTVERLVRFWDFQDTIESAHFVDCALRYQGAATASVYNLWHLEGQSVEGLADGIPFKTEVENGAITLSYPATNILVGLPFRSYMETARIEAGAADGTSQGKEKRANNVVVSLWQSAGGRVGRWNEDQKSEEWVDIEYEEPYDELQAINLQGGMFGPFILPAGYGKRGSLLLEQTEPLPFNVIGLFPQMNTQDR